MQLFFVACMLVTITSRDRPRFLERLKDKKRNKMVEIMGGAVAEEVTKYLNVKEY